MKNLKKIVIGSLIAAAIFTSCRGHETPEGEGTLITLSSRLNMHSKSTLQDVQIEEGQKVGLLVTKAGSPETMLYVNEELTADGDGNFACSTPMYYPITGDNVDMYAYHPYTGGIATSFEIQADQTSESNYLNSDLLFASVSDIAKSSSAVQMAFNHKLSKVNFTIKEGVGMDLSNLSNVEILNVLPEVGFSLITGTITAASGTPTAIQTYGVRGVEEEEGEVSGISAIITPQQFVTGSQLFKITINGNTEEEVSYIYTLLEDFDFEEGKKYDITITVNSSSITTISTISDWEITDPFEGVIE